MSWATSRGATYKIRYNPEANFSDGLFYPALLPFNLSLGNDPSVHVCTVDKHVSVNFIVSAFSHPSAIVASMNLSDSVSPIHVFSLTRICAHWNSKSNTDAFPRLSRPITADGYAGRILSSASCIGSTVPGAPVIASLPRCVFGNAITSRIEVESVMSIARRSMPSAMPPCGGAP